MSAPAPPLKSTKRKLKLKQSLHIYNMVLWDPALDAWEFTITYEDRFDGLQSVPLLDWAEAGDPTVPGIPFHRIRQFVHTDLGVVWDRAARMDRVHLVRQRFLDSQLAETAATA